MKHKLFNFKDQKGYTLLFSVLVSSLVLSIGISILITGRKEFLIATSARDSTAALYAADAGLECAIFNDLRDVFSIEQDVDNRGKFSCYVSNSGVTKNGTIFTFHSRFGGSGTSCAVVTVSKSVVNNEIRTEIRSYGYNTGWNNDVNSSTYRTCSIGSAKRVERALRYTSS